jgi:hypothetical protein
MSKSDLDFLYEQTRRMEARGIGLFTVTKTTTITVTAQPKHGGRRKNAGRTKIHTDARARKRAYWHRSRTRRNQAKFAKDSK